MWRFVRWRVDSVSMRPRVVPLCNPNSFEKCCNSRRQGPPLSAYISFNEKSWCAQEGRPAYAD